jgi:hypothetical protein
VPVLYYEDLPYAASATEETIAARARGRLAWRVPLTERQLETKLQALSAYASQLTADDLSLVAAHARRRGDCEERLYGNVEPDSIAGCLRALHRIG